MRRAAAILVALAMAAVPGVAQAATTYYAKGGGKSSSTCEATDPCSLAKAVNSAVDGDSVVLLAGANFTPTNKVSTEEAIDIGGVPGATRPTIEAADGKEALAISGGAHLHDVNVISHDAEALLLSGSTAERVIAEAEIGAFDACRIFNATLIDSVCRSREGTAVQLSGGFIVPAEGTLRNVTALGATGGLAIQGAANIFTVKLTAIDTIASGEGHPDVVVDSLNNGGPTSVELRNSDYATSFIAEPGGTVTPPGTNGNVTAPAQFVDAAKGDLHQLPTSPTIDAGATEAADGALDLDGNPRALAGHPICGDPPAGPTDIGAYEYVPSGCSPPPASNTVSPPPPPATVRPAAPGTTLKKAKIDSAKGTAAFTFSGSGAVSGFACELVRPVAKATRSGKKPKPKKPSFAGCGSPKAYKNLKPGRYTFKVEATGPGGTDLTPALRKFKIGG
jgi:hypothetical protein